MTREEIQEQHPLLPKLLRECYQVFAVPEGKENSRLRCATQARAAFLMLVRAEYYRMFTFTDIGRIMALISERSTPYDHATVIHAVRVGKETMLLRDEVSEIFRENVLHLKKTFFPLKCTSTIKPITKPLTCPIH